MATISTVGNHNCDTPGPQVELAERLWQQARENGKAKWRCPVCGSRWAADVDFYKCEPRDDRGNLDYHRALRWRRVGASTWRWKRRTKREIVASLSGSEVTR